MHGRSKALPGRLGAAGSLEYQRFLFGDPPGTLCGSPPLLWIADDLRLAACRQGYRESDKDVGLCKYWRRLMHCTAVFQVRVSRSHWVARHRLKPLLQKITSTTILRRPCRRQTLVRLGSGWLRTRSYPFLASYGGAHYLANGGHQLAGLKGLVMKRTAPSSKLRRRFTSSSNAVRTIAATGLSSASALRCSRRPKPSSCGSDRSRMTSPISFLRMRARASRPSPESRTA